MNRNKLIIGFVGLVVLAATIMLTQNANSKDVIKYDNTFVGESENWTAEMYSKGKEVFYEEDDVLKRDHSAQSEFRITYKGELSELSDVKRLEYHFETSSGGGGLEMNYDRPPKEKTFTRSGNRLLREDAVIDVTVTWDEKTEEFTLENKE